MVREVEVSGKLNTKDVMIFMLYHNYSRIGGMLTGIFGILGIILAPVMFLTQDMISGIILAGVGLIYGIVTPLGFYSRARRQLRTNPVFKNVMNFTFTSDDLKVDIYTGKAEILWQDIYRIKVLKGQVLVYLKETQALILPIRNFASEEDVSLVKDFVGRNNLEIPSDRRLEVEIHDEEN